jgi:hypothetical protein
MATFRAIGATGVALVGLRRDRYPQTEFGWALDIEPYQTRNFEKATAEGLSVFLFRVGPNAIIRNLPPHRLPDGRVMRPSLQLDLHFMITPWSESTQQHHRMLSWAMRMFEDLGTLSASQRNSYVSEIDAFVPDEAVDIVFDPLPLSDYLRLWDRMRTFPASASCGCCGSTLRSASPKRRNCRAASSSWARCRRERRSPDGRPARLLSHHLPAASNDRRCHRVADD